MRKRPQRGVLYSLRQIELDLILDDLAFLMVKPPSGGWTPIQTSHISREQMLGIPGFDMTRWKHIEITREWIPVFHFAEHGLARAQRPITDFVNMDLTSNGWWVTLKAYPRDPPEARRKIYVGKKP